MSATAIRKMETTGNNQQVDVLYQRVGGRWYAFSAQDNEVFFGAIPDEILCELENSGADCVSGEAIHAALSGAPQKQI